LPLDDYLAGFQDGWPSSPMNRAVDAASAHQRRVGGVHDGIAGFASNIARAGYRKPSLRSQKHTERLAGNSHAI
jgi:hypothetical protein